MTEHDIAMVLGALFVVYHALQRFNTPASNRSSTTALRYHLGAGAYGGIALLSYLLLSRFPDLLTQLGSTEIDEFTRKLPRALLTAMVLTVFLEKLPFVAPLDLWLRRELQHIARIPSEVRRWSRVLQQARFQPPPELRQRLQRSLLADGFDADDLVFQDDGGIRFRWMRNEALMAALAAWETEHAYHAFLADPVQDLPRLKARQRQLRDRAQRHFRVLRELGPDAGRNDALATLQREFDQQVDDLFVELCDAISRAVLRCRLAEPARRADLRGLGFVDLADAPPAAWRHLSPHQLASVFAMTTCVLLFGTVMAAANTNFSFGQRLLLVAMIGATYCASVWCALYPKERWAAARREHERPVGAYVASGLVAVAFGLVLNFAFKCLIFIADEQPVLKALASVGGSLPWTTMSFTMAAMTAFNADNPEGVLGRWQRWGEAALQAAAMALAALAAIEWRRSGGATVPLDAVLRIVATAALNGAVVGFIVPHWYRHSLRRHLGADEAGSGDGTPPVVLVAGGSRTAQG